MFLVSAGPLDRFGAWSLSCSAFLALSHTGVPSPRLGRFGQYGPRLVHLGCLWYSAYPKIGCFCRSADPLPLQRPAIVLLGQPVPVLRRVAYPVHCLSVLRLLLRSAVSPRPLQRWVAPAFRLSRARFLHGRRPNSSVFVHLYSSVVDVVLFIIIVIFGVCSLSFSLFCFYPSRGEFLNDRSRVLSFNIHKLTHTQKQNKTQTKTQQCLSPVSDRDADQLSRLPAVYGAVKCLSPASDRDADTRSRLPATDGAVKCLSPASDRECLSP